MGFPGNEYVVCEHDIHDVFHTKDIRLTEQEFIEVLDPPLNEYRASGKTKLMKEIDRDREKIHYQNSNRIRGEKRAVVALLKIMPFWKVQKL